MGARGGALQSSPFKARQRAQAKEKEDTSPAPTGPRPLALWTFEGGSLQDQVGGMHAGLKGSARVERGRLILDGKNSYASTGPLGKDVSEKTLEAWVYLPTLKQGGGGAISLQTPDGKVFDSIVFAEREKNKWMAGSNGFARTRNVSGQGENSNPATAVHMAIVYKADNSVSIYRNGELYGQSYTPGGRVTYRKGRANVLLGLRHQGGGNGFLRAEIEQAALYDRALSEKEIRASIGSRGSFVSLEEILAELTPQQRKERKELLEKAQNIRAQISALPRGGGKTYAGRRRQPKPTRRLIKGNVREPAEAVRPGGLSVISLPSGDFGLAENAPEAERRIRFANWLADPKNPLPARVMTNRIFFFYLLLFQILFLFLLNNLQLYLLILLEKVQIQLL